MIYWEDMTDKYGFNDGEAVPPDAEQRRSVYVMAVNRFAKALSSQYRVEAYDRPGMHNWCLVLTVTADGTPNSEERSDAALEDAIAMAYDIHLDAFVETKVTIHTHALHTALVERCDMLKKQGV